MNGVFSVAFNHNDQKLASGSCDCTVRLWDCAQGTCDRVLQGDNSYSVTRVVFSPTGEKLVSWCNSTISLWDCVSGKCDRILEGHDGLGVRSTVLKTRINQHDEKKNV